MDLGSSGSIARSCVRMHGLWSRVLVAVLAGGLASSAAFGQQPAADLISDRVGSTAGQFRVDESGAATYSIPIYVPPGTAGVAPQLALSYSSQAGNGIAGRGWTLSGTSSITRCRASREHGDFIVNGQPVDGNPGPVNFSSGDKFCLDGQRLLPAPATAAACKTLSGATIEQFRTEIESFQRVCAYTFNAANGPRFFTVERRDGSTSWYGDRESTGGAEAGSRNDGYVESNWRHASGLHVAGTVIAHWLQTRFQDSTGNYIDYRYLKDPSGTVAGGVTGEAVLSEVNYTGKVVLPGQTGSARLPYAGIRFAYEAAPVSIGYQSGARFFQSQRLSAITVVNGATVVRHYAPTYAASVSGTGATVMTRLTECSDSTRLVCLPPTEFDWSTAGNSFLTSSLTTYVASDYHWTGGYGGDGFLDMKFGDVNGDGRQDIVFMHKMKNDTACYSSKLAVSVAYATGGASSAGYSFKGPQCMPTNLYSDSSSPGGEGWFLADYDGDGRDDLIYTTGNGGSVRGSLALGDAAGSNFSGGIYLAYSFGSGIPGSGGKEKQPKPADLNGDGLTDIVYYTNNGLKARLMEKVTPTPTQPLHYTWGEERSVTAPDVCAGLVGCAYSIEGLYRKKGYQQLNDFNGDARSDLLLYLKVTAPCTAAILLDGGDISSTGGTSGA